LTAATAAGWFAAERPAAGKKYRPIAAGAVQQAPAHSSKCG